MQLQTASTASGIEIGKEAALAFAGAGVTAVAFADAEQRGVRDDTKESSSSERGAEYRLVAPQFDVPSERSVLCTMELAEKESWRVEYNMNSDGVSAPSEFASFATNYQKDTGIPSNLGISPQL